MVSVLLKNDNLKLSVPKGTTFRSLAQKSGASMIFGCRVGDCSTCGALVSKGMECLSEPTEKEKLLFNLVEPLENLRFMCQCTITAESGEIEIEYL